MLSLTEPSAIRARVILPGGKVLRQFDGIATPMATGLMVLFDEDVRVSNGQALEIENVPNLEPPA